MSESNAVANLETLHLGDENTSYCDLSAEGACDLLWSVLQKAPNLKHLQLPGAGTFKDMKFLLGGVWIQNISDESKEFLKFLNGHSSLVKNLPILATGGNQMLDAELFALAIECIAKATKLKSCNMWKANLSPG